MVREWVYISKCVRMLMLSRVGGSKKNKTLTDAYVRYQGWVGIKKP